MHPIWLPSHELLINTEPSAVACLPAMAAGLTDHVWSIREWLTYPVVQRE